MDIKNVIDRVAADVFAPDTVDFFGEMERGERVLTDSDQEKTAGKLMKADWDISGDIDALNGNLRAYLQSMGQRIRSLKRDIDMVQGGDRRWENTLRVMKAEYAVLTKLEADISAALKAYYSIR